MDAYQWTADVFKVLGHPARLQILAALADEGEACVCHLEWRLGMRQAYLSQQLARLREAGLVEDMRQGLNIFYRLASPDLIEPLASLQEHIVDLAPNPTSLDTPHMDPSRACPCPRCNPTEEILR
jgi:DNA-binding transcriptional ArsR family regulator